MAGELAPDRRGTTAVEFALVAPLLFALLLGVLELGRLIWVDAALDHALAGAARCAGAAGPPCRRALGQELGRGLARLGVTDVVPRLTRTPAPCGTEVEARLAYPPLVPALWPSRPILSARACLAAA